MSTDRNITQAENDECFDFVAIGSGAAGFAAARRAALNGLRTALVELAFFGGTCVNSGCIPTKYLLNGTLAQFLAQSPDLGNLEFWTELQAKKNAFATKNREQMERQADALGIHRIKGRASFNGTNSLFIQGEGHEMSLNFKHCLIATGSKPFFPGGISPDNKAIFSSVSALNWHKRPDRLLLIGGGPISLELGELMHRLGSAITLVERTPRLLINEEPEISTLLQECLAKRKWQVYLDAEISSVSSQNNVVSLRLKSGEELQADAALIALGRRALSNGLHLEKAGVQLMDNGAIATDAFLQAAPNIYAAGDCTGKAMLANHARHQAEYVLERLLGKTTAPYTPGVLPACIYGGLEIMRVGPLEVELRKSQVDIKVKHFKLEENVLEQSSGAGEGILKMIWASGRLRSVSAAGYGVSHLGAAASLLIDRGTQFSESYLPFFACPTLEETLQQAIDS